MDCGIGYFLGKGFLVPPLLKSWKSGKKWVLITYYYTQSGMDNGLKSAGVQCWGGLQWSEGNNSAVQRELCGKNHEISPPLWAIQGEDSPNHKNFPPKILKGGGVDFFHDFCHRTPPELLNWPPPWSLYSPLSTVLGLPPDLNPVATPLRNIGGVSPNQKNSPPPKIWGGQHFLGNLGPNWNPSP